MTTIVGGRPPGSGKPLGPIPRGIDVLVKKAAVDPEFRALLLFDRQAAADEIGLQLDPAEAAMLAAVPPAQLETIIDRTTVPAEHRRAFLGKVAAAMLATMGLATAGCGRNDFCRGSQPFPDWEEEFEPPDEPAPRRARPASLARVIAVLGRHTPFDNEDVAPTKRLLADLKIDGDGACKSLESEFNVVMSRRAFGELGTVEDLARRVDVLVTVSGPALDTMVKHLEVTRARLRGETTLDGDLDVSRLDRAQLRRRLARQFRVYLDWDEFKEFDTVGDVVDQVARQVHRREQAAAEKASEPERPPSPVSRGVRPDLPRSFGIQPDLPHGSSGFGGVRPD